jgi:hypothetical protein
VEKCLTEVHLEFAESEQQEKDAGVLGKDDVLGSESRIRR